MTLTDNRDKSACLNVKSFFRVIVSGPRDGFYFLPSVPIFSDRVPQDQGPPLPPDHHVGEQLPIRGREHQQLIPGGCKQSHQPVFCQMGMGVDLLSPVHPVHH